MLKDKLVLVTGAAGFIGSHLVEALLEQGASVKALVRYNSRSDWGWLEAVRGTAAADKLSVVLGDIRDAEQVRTISAGADYIFHLAALIGIPYSYEAPQSYVETNIQGTLNVLNAAKAHGCRRVVVTSTSEVYGTALHVPIRENHPLQPQSPYSATKIAADAIAESFYRSFNTPVVIARPFNTYGPRQSARAVIPTIITQLLAGKTEIELGNAETTRDLVYAGDTVEGFIRLALAEGIEGKAVNIATGRDVSIGELAKLLIQILNPNAKVVSVPNRVRPVKSEVYRLCGSAELLFELTNWRPGTNLNAGLETTVKWFKQNMHNYRVGQYHV